MLQVGWPETGIAQTLLLRCAPPSASHTPVTRLLEACPREQPVHSSVTTILSAMCVQPSAQVPQGSHCYLT